MEKEAIYEAPWSHVCGFEPHVLFIVELLSKHAAYVFHLLHFAAT